MNVRPAEPRDLKYLAQASPQPIPESELKGSWVVVNDNDEPVVVFRFQHRYIVEPLSIIGEVEPKALRRAFYFIDDAYFWMGTTEYEWFVPDCEGKFQEFVRNSLSKEGDIDEYTPVQGVFFTRYFRRDK